MNAESVVDAEIVDPEWRFESAISTPDGVRIRAEVTVPDRLAGADLGEVGELVHMAANKTLSHLRTSSGVSHL
ncbi:hypothetical protein [Prauserella cavernicola]|uniref:Uncharacterized protein n=1 Tax=Prauserella cavernicola TaxID=2800127 RepID=A0A934V295_9PSEU|nr:hypothetical protein [Prauserella cavernicola]MBK1785111.1 hypothetical protein [Prauserella cavernicola]